MEYIPFTEAGKYFDSAAIQKVRAILPEEIRNLYYAPDQSSKKNPLLELADMGFTMDRDDISTNHDKYACGEKDSGK